MGRHPIDKSYASAFYGTSLLSILIKLKVDTLIIAGGTTGGCVRAATRDEGNAGDGLFSAAC